MSGVQQKISGISGARTGGRQQEVERKLVQVIYSRKLSWRSYKGNGRQCGLPAGAAIAARNGRTY